MLAREWDSFNRFASFILHDLKNLATLQGMTLENAKHLRHNPNFISDAFETFSQTTEKMINLIASLSVQRGQFSFKQQPVNILEVIAHTFDDLKLDQRKGRKDFDSVSAERPTVNDLRRPRAPPEGFHQFAPQCDSKPAERRRRSRHLGFAAELRQDHRFHPRQRMRHSFRTTGKTISSLSNNQGKGPGDRSLPYALDHRSPRWTNPHRKSGQFRHQSRS